MQKLLACEPRLITTRVCAVDGNVIPKEQLEAEWKRGNTDEYTRSSPARIGVWLSHVLCWKQVIENSWQCALILEDDVAMPCLNNVLWKQLTRVAVPMLNHRKLHAILLGWDFESSSGTHAYLISQSGAQTLLKMYEEQGILQAIDWQFVAWFQAGNIKMAQFPFLMAQQIFHHSDSDVRLT